MRILFCNYEYPPLGGGAGRMNALLAREMAKCHEVTVLTSQALGLPSESIQDGVKVVRVQVFFRTHKAVANLPSMLAFVPMGIRAGKKLAGTNKYDVINTHFVLPTGPVGDALSRLGGIPNVLSLHGGDVYTPNQFTSPHRHRLLRAWIRWLLRRADMVVGQSRNTLENMRRYYAPEIEGVRIPLGIQKPKVGAASRRRYGCREDDVLLVTVARLVGRKAIGQLVSMMEALRKEKVRLLIVGIGPEQQLLKRDTLKRQLGDKVLFMGRVQESEKFEILQMCDIYASTSQHEGFGLVFLEAMACGLPIICYDHGGQTDFLEDTATGYLVPLNDLASFRDRCLRLVKDGNLRQRIGRENLRRVEGFSIERCAKCYEAVFQEAIARYRRT